MFKRILIPSLMTIILSLATPCWAACGPTYGADGIAVDSQGNVWMTHYEDARVGFLKPGSNEFTEFLASTKANPETATHAKGSSSDGFNYSYDTGFSGIALDEKHGNLWTAQWNASKMVRFSLKEHSFSEIALPGRPNSRGPILMDGHGNVWVVAQVWAEDKMSVREGRVVAISPSGKIIKDLTTPVKDYVSQSVALDPQGRVWLALTPRGEGRQVEIYKLADDKFQKQKAAVAGRAITGMAFDSKGNLWFSIPEKNVIGRFAEGKVTYYTLPTAKAFPLQISVDGRDNVWFVEYLGQFERGKIGRLSPDGRLREYDVPPEDEWVVTFTFDQSGNLWLSTIQNYNLLRLDPETGNIREFTIPTPSNWSEDAASASLTCSISSATVMEKAKTDLPTPLRYPKGYPHNPSAVLFEKSCSQCHTWYRVDKVARRRKEWAPTVDRMIGANGARFITPEEREQIIRYLNENYSMRTVQR